MRLRTPFLLSVLLAFTLASAAGAQAAIRTTITFEPGADGAAPVWDVRVVADDLPAGVRVQLADWGEWSAFDALYVDWVACDPPFAEGPPHGEQHALADDTGQLSLHYRLHPTRIGSDEQQRFNLLPSWSSSYSFGFAANSVVELLAEGSPIEAERVLELVAPEELEIFSGFGGVSRARQITALDAPLGNALIAFGTPATRLYGDREGVELEVLQFGLGHDATESVLDTVLNVVPAIQRTTRRPAKSPVRILIADSYGGGTATDHGLRIGYTRDTPAWQRDSYYFHQHVAHELFHEWLGIYLQPVDEGLVWFFEGFTDYCALWHVAATGTVTREWFAERLGELESEARTRSSLGRIAFADEGVQWRDGDGPNEIMAYKGGALLAFALDAELRARGQGRVTDLIADLCARETRTYSLADIQAWLEGHGLAGFYAQHMAGKGLPALASDLARVGFELRAEPATLTYLGARTDEGDWGGAVLALDPDGPLAQAGLLVGDVITGYSPERGHPRPRIAAVVETEFRFGLATFEPGHTGTFVSVDRDGQALRFDVTARSIAGGLLETLTEVGEATDAFFALPD